MSEVNERTEKLQGIIRKVTYHNEQNGYTVAQLDLGTEEITVVGNMPFISHGDDITAYGYYTVHSVYGPQFKVESMEKNMPTDSATLLRYLSTGAIKGVGPSTARKIVETFREDTLFVIENTPEKLANINGISFDKAKAIGEQFAKQFGLREVMLLLARFKISNEESIKAYKILGTDAVNKIKRNPYLLCSEKIDFPFEKAEDIAEYYNIAEDDAVRVCAGIEYVLRKNSYNGHTCLPREKLVAVTCELLGVYADIVDISVDRLIQELKVRSIFVGKSEFVALPSFYNGEEYIATKLTVMASRKINAFVDDREMTFLENSIGIKFDQKQKLAVKTSLENSITLLTGGPGTGKTTVLRAMIEMFSHRDMKIELAAPTGRAAKRMSELTGFEAKTLHRLLEVEWTNEDNLRFARNERNPLECEVLILDEVSMVDTLLFESVLRALPLNSRLILVGDSDQLPSVAAGNVLGDIIDSDKFNVVRLDKVFRQAQESAIIRTAHDIIEDKIPDLTVKDSDFFFLHRIHTDDTIKTLCELCIERLPNAYGFEPFKDIQVLCPSRKMTLGTINLNNVLQDLLNPKEKNNSEIFFKGFFLREKDKVMQIKNNYELCWKKDNKEEGTGVFNGDVGFVEKIDKRNGTVTVRFDDKTVKYFTEELSQIELAYAVTVHKSQGSEYDCVILPLFDVPTKLKYRNLLYTAVTRAKKLLIVVGDDRVFYSMAQNNKKSLRYTLLKEFLKVSYE